MYHKILLENYATPIRLDRYLRALNPLLSQGIIEQMLRKKLIKVNDKKSESNHRVVNGDIISISETVKNQILSYKENIEFNPMIESLAQKILHEYLLFDHEDFIAINKPSGLATQGGSKLNISIDHALKFLSNQNMDLKLVHRLDKDTSGILVIAKNRSSSEKFMQAFMKHKIHKKYLAILSNIPNQNEGVIRSFLIKEKDFVVTSYRDYKEGAKEAITNYKVESIIGDIALVVFEPLTGRMHQLRVHSAYELGIPILGDVKYGGKEYSHLMLHSSELVIDQTIFGEEIFIKAPMPKHFQSLIVAH